MRIMLLDIFLLDHGIWNASLAAIVRGYSGILILVVNRFSEAASKHLKD